MITLALQNPYRESDFFQFFFIFFQRMMELLQGKIGMHQLMSDEIQIFVLWGLCISSALIGSFLVLKKMSMMANALCHTILLGIVIAFIILKPILSQETFSSSFLSLKVMSLASLLSGLLTTVLTQFLVKYLKVQEDASIGLVFTTLFALGIVLVTLFSKSAHLGTEAIMGNIDALDKDDLQLVGVVAAFNLLFFIIFFRGIATSTFDHQFSLSIGFPVSFLNYLVMVLTAATCIASFRAVGVLLVLTFFVGPPLMARLLTNHLKTMILLSFLLPAGLSLASVALSRHILVFYKTPLSTAGLCVCVFSFVYFLLILFAPKKGILSAYIKKKLSNPSAISH